MNNNNSLLQSIIDLNNTQLEQLSKYYELLLEYSKVMNLTTITEENEVYIKHFYDSILTLKNHNILDNQNLLDVGSGAGFPGLVLKIVYPNLSVTLLEPTKKRCDFLNVVISKLGLNNISVINDRAENYIKDNRESYDFVVARAVANMNIISELCIPFVKLEGKFIALKGQNYNEECQHLGDSITKLGGKIDKITSYELPNELGKRALIEIKKLKNTPLKYPRNYSQIKNKPLK